jgi:hypothetical protein
MARTRFTVARACRGRSLTAAERHANTNGAAMIRYTLFLGCLLVAGASFAQTMYRCENNGKVEYSDKPCLEGVEVKRLAPDGGPTPEDRARAQMRAKAEQQRREAQERADAKQRRQQLGIAGAPHGSALP